MGNADQFHWVDGKLESMSDEAPSSFLSDFLWQKQRCMEDMFQVKVTRTPYFTPEAPVERQHSKTRPSRPMSGSVAAASQEQ